MPHVKQSERQSGRHLRVLATSALPFVALFAALAVSTSVPASPPVQAENAANVAPTAKPSRPHHHWFQIGKATWYGRDFQGKPTATGEAFDMNALTCAHRTLPLGSWLRVTNLRNHRFTFVRVNDRGPYTAGAIVDLSYAAARRVGMFGKAQVRVEQVSPSDPELAHALLAQLTPAEPTPGTAQPTGN